MTQPQPIFRVATPADYRGAHSKPLPDSVVEGSNYRFTVLTEGVIRLEWASDGAFEDRPSTFAIFRDLPTPDFTVTREENGQLRIQTSCIDLTYDGRPFSTAGLQAQVRGNVTAHQSTWRYNDDARLPAWDHQDDFDKRVPARVNLGGTARTLDEADGPVPLEPGVVSTNGFAVIDDTSSMLFTGDGWVAPRPERADGEYRDLYLFAHGLAFGQAVADFFQISGAQPPIPRWALGNWWSRYYPYRSSEFLTLMDEFEARGIPLSVAVMDMDWHITDVDPLHGPGWTGYSWNRELIPDPPALLSALHERNLRVSLNVHPADGIQPHEDAYPEFATAMGIDPASRRSVLFDATSQRFMDNYFSLLHHPLEEQGVDNWWIDWQSGNHSRVNGIDPLWVLNHAHYLDSGRNGSTPLTFSRYAGPGSHRYPIGFSGDAHITWESLEFQPYFTATAANIGFGWWSHDIGGHMAGYRDDELATRWAQYGVFSPILRLHSSASPYLNKEPWLLEAPYSDLVVNALRLRNALVPYIHSMNLQTSKTGLPLVQPLYHRSTDARALRHPTEYWFGSELVVAPITSRIDPVTRLGATKAFLPEGRWYDLHTGYGYDGDREIMLHRDLTSIPVLLKAGGIIPMSEPMSATDQNPDHLTLTVAAGASGQFELVEDDGRGRTAMTLIKFDHDRGRITITPPTSNAEIVPAERTWTLELIGFGPIEGADRIDAMRQRVSMRGSAFESQGLRETCENPVLERAEALIRKAWIGSYLKEALVAAFERGPAGAIAELGTIEAPSTAGRDEPYARAPRMLVDALIELIGARAC